MAGTAENSHGARPRVTPGTFALGHINRMVPADIVLPV